ncbi:MAG TPA: polyprenyl synthetase family protein [Candidatus Saccharimonadales bacterium]|nr:polyprenyl synthetase family protein [Candidatus Saccharimonadales bacterium]
MSTNPTVVASFKEQLAGYKSLLEPDVAQFCERFEQEVQQDFGDYSLEAVKAFTSILTRGGKRVRGSLVMAAYEMAGGTDLSRVLPVARAMEILQVYLLIADDIYDRSLTRRGGPTAHVMMRDLHQSNHWRGDAEHFGESVASCATLIASNVAMEEITLAPLSDCAKVAILRIVNKALRITDYGQINDIVNEAVGTVATSQVERTLIWKTAYYSFIGPLQIGAIAAGAKESDVASLHNYGLHMGLSFQIADDILGTFGNEAESGKSTMDDLREGKMTVLVSHALQHASRAGHRELRSYLGKSDLTLAEYERCKQIITETGSLAYARDMAVSHGKIAIEALENAPASWRSDKLDFLRALANYVVTRKA